MGFGEVFVYRAGKQDWFAAGLPREGEQADKPVLADAIREGLPTCSLHERLGTIRPRVEHAGFDTCAVIAPDRTLLGVLRSQALQGSTDQTAEELMQPVPSTFRPNVTLEEMAGYLRDHELSSTLVTNSEGQLLGIAYREDVEATLEHERHSAK
jgi:Mg/Co/Ni transporter MgtE